jgi:hypothetical protein
MDDKRSAKIMDRLYVFSRETVQFLENLLIHDRIRLSEIPFLVRTLDSGIYVMALRISRGWCERFVGDLRIMCDDIEKLDGDDDYKNSIVDTLRFNIEVNSYKETEVFKDFERNISQKVQCELLRNRGTSEKIITAELRKAGFV